jgi:hypothetical protein
MHKAIAIVDMMSTCLALGINEAKIAEGMSIVQCTHGYPYFLQERESTCGRSPTILRTR